MSQTNGLLPTDTATSDADINKQNANKTPGKSFTDGQSNLMPGQQQTSAGGDMANAVSNDAFNHPVPVKHGKVDTLTDDPTNKTLLALQPVENVGPDQKAARIGNTGADVSVNGVGLQAVANTSTAGVIEKHVVSGVSFTANSTVTVPLNLTSPVSILAVYSGATAAAGSFSRNTVGLSGAGWIPNSNSIVFTSGLIPTLSGAAVRFQIPASGADFYIDYTYSTITAAPTTKAITGLDNSLTPNYIPNVGNRFAR